MVGVLMPKATFELRERLQDGDVYGAIIITDGCFGDTSVLPQLGSAGMQKDVRERSLDAQSAREQAMRVSEQGRQIFQLLALYPRRDMDRPLFDAMLLECARLTSVHPPSSPGTKQRTKRTTPNSVRVPRAIAFHGFMNEWERGQCGAHSVEFCKIEFSRHGQP